VVEGAPGCPREEHLGQFIAQLLAQHRHELEDAVGADDAVRAGARGRRAPHHGRREGVDGAHRQMVRE
jgi:hypothetical protein